MASLYEPTRARMSRVIFNAVGASTLIYVLFGVSGFVVAGNTVSKGNPGRAGGMSATTTSLNFIRSE